MAYVEVKCIDCESTEVIKFGKRANGHQRYRCKSCKKTFQLEYTYKACEPSIKEKISGTRDTARTLKIARGTVASTLEMDEMEIMSVRRRIDLGYGGQLIMIQIHH